MFLLSLLLAFIMFEIIFFWHVKLKPSYRQRVFWMQREQELTSSVSQMKQEVARKRYFIRKVMTDPKFRERIVREHTSFVKPGEYVIFFKKSEEHLKSDTTKPSSYLK